MQTKNIILLGGSNSVRKDGIQKGLKKGIEAFNSKNTSAGGGGGILALYSLALGSSRSIQNLYELKREKNKKILENAELIVTESNVNDGHPWAVDENIPLNILYRNINWYYKELYFLNKKIVVVLLPLSLGHHHELINNIHRKLCNKYGFNCIDMQKYYKERNLSDFNNPMRTHPLAYIMATLGKNIMLNLENLKSCKKLDIKNDNPDFKICLPSDFETNKTLQTQHLKNSAFDELAYKIPQGYVLKFPKKFLGYYPVAMHTWNNFEGRILKATTDEAYVNYASVLFKNNSFSISKDCNAMNLLTEVDYKGGFKIDENSSISYDDSVNATNKERHYIVRSFQSNYIKIDHFDLIGIFLASNIDCESVDFNALENESISIIEKYDFSALIPPVVDYKEMIDEYCKTADALKFQAYQNEINRLNAELQKLQNLQNAQKEDLNAKNLELENTIKQLQIKELNQNILLKDLKIRKLAKELGLSIN